MKVDYYEEEEEEKVQRLDRGGERGVLLCLKAF